MYCIWCMISSDFQGNLIQVNRPILQLGKTVKKSKLHHWFLVEFQSDNLKSYVSPGWEERSRESLAMQQILPDETALKLRSSQFPELQLTFLWGLQMPFPISPICGFTETSYCKPSMPQTKLIFLPKSASPLILLCYNNNSLYLLKIFCLKNGTKSSNHNFQMNHHFKIPQNKYYCYHTEFAIEKTEAQSDHTAEGWWGQDFSVGSELGAGSAYLTIWSASALS